MRKVCAMENINPPITFSSLVSSASTSLALGQLISFLNAGRDIKRCGIRSEAQQVSKLPRDRRVQKWNEGHIAKLELFKLLQTILPFCV